MADPTIKDLAYRGLASVLGGPVDLATMVMRPFGYNVPEQQVVGGSEWIGKQLEDVGLVSSARAPVQEFITSMAIPTPSGLTKGAALGGAALGGMITQKGKGVTSSIDDANKVAAMIKSLGPEFNPKIEIAKGGSVYLTVDRMPLTKSGQVAKNRNPTNLGFKARFADHPSYWGGTISSDPITQNDPETVYQMFLHSINKASEPPHAKSVFDPSGMFAGTVTDIEFKEGLSHRGNPVIKRVATERPFSFVK